MRYVLLCFLLAACREAAPAEPAPSTYSAAPWPAVEAAPVAELATETRPLPRDIAAMRRAMSVVISPDGQNVAYLVRVPSLDADATPDGDSDQSGGWTTETQLYVVPRSGGEPRQLTHGKASVSSPHFSPDGTQIAFARNHEGKRRIHVLPLGGGEARVVDTGAYEPGDFAWAPDGQHFAFTTTRPPTDEARLARFRSGGARRFDREWQQRHLFIVDASGGEPVHVNQGTDSIVSFAWSPDGSQFALVVADSSDPYESWMRHRVKIISADGGDEASVAQSEVRNVAQVAWSPEGTHLAWLRTNETLSMLNQLVVFDTRTQETQDLTTDLDVSMTGFVWTKNGREVVAVVQDRTRSRLQRLPLQGAPAVLEHGERVVYASGSDAQGQYMVAMSSTSTSPWAPSVIDTRTGRVAVLADVNPQVSEWTLASVRVVQWTNESGDTIEGVLFETSGEGPRPLMVLPHGGPDSVTQEAFSSWGHYFAARGYSVLRPNYRGGFGYGKTLYEANRGRLGAIELEDIESGVTHLIEEGIADPDQLYYGGWSWGGYLSAWTLTHSGERYRAFVVGAGITDTVVQYVTSDINHGEVADWEFRGRPWRQPETYARTNPALHFQHATQPTLILHGERDRRVDFVQGQLLYRALEDAECEVEFFAYPREPHGFREPAHIEHSLLQWAAWYDRHRD
ncbi:MAG: S9 family peptidase [Myxococcota bacterium]